MTPRNVLVRELEFREKSTGLDGTQSKPVKTRLYLKKSVKIRSGPLVFYVLGLRHIQQAHAAFVCVRVHHGTTNLEIRRQRSDQIAGGISA